jgi:hypothetical protein
LISANARIQTNMNLFERKPTQAAEAEIKFLDGDFRIVKPGTFVRCGLTGEPIPVEELRYWDVDRQEAYARPEHLLERRGVAGKSSG